MSRSAGILRVIEGRQGTVEVQARVAPRFDYGQVRPWIRRHGQQVHSAIGGNDGLIVFSELELTEDPSHELVGRRTVSVGERIHLLLTYSEPELIDADPPSEPEFAALDSHLERTVRWWRNWARAVALEGPDEQPARRSAVVLKALTYAPTGAIAAAPTTSLPETIGGVRNWDYRYAWVRDSSFSSRAFAEVGCVDEADAFRAFIMRSAAGHAEDLQIMYGVGGERRIEPLDARRAGGLPRFATGADRQPGCRPAPARRVRGARQFDVALAPPGTFARVTMTGASWCR